MSSLYAEPIAPDLLGMLARHTDRDDIVDDFAIAREMAEENMRGRGLKASPGLTEAERSWAARADRLLYLMALEPAECLVMLREHAAGWTVEPSPQDIARGVIPYPTRYLAEVGPKLVVAAERLAALRERRDIATWARREHGNPLSF